MSQEIILLGYNLFKSKLLPAVLTDTKVNSNIMSAWLVSNSITIETLTTPEQVADALRRSVDANYRKLIWTKRPAKLQFEIENSKGITPPTARESENAFAEKLKQDEAAKKAAKASEAALRRTNARIEQFQLLDRMGTGVMYGRTGIAQDKARKFVAQQLAAKTDAEVIERAVEKFLTSLYEEDERSKERV